jgi:hypothetical protein
MVAPLSDEGMKPAVQEISRAEFETFIAACRDAPAPTARLPEQLRHKPGIKSAFATHYPR